MITYNDLTEEEKEICNEYCDYLHSIGCDGDLRDVYAYKARAFYRLRTRIVNYILCNDSKAIGERSNTPSNFKGITNDYTSRFEAMPTLRQASSPAKEQKRKSLLGGMPSALTMLRQRTCNSDKGR